MKSNFHTVVSIKAPPFPPPPPSNAVDSEYFTFGLGWGRGEGKDSVCCLKMLDFRLFLTRVPRRLCRVMGVYVILVAIVISFITLLVQLNAHFTSSPTILHGNQLARRQAMLIYGWGSITHL